MKNKKSVDKKLVDAMLGVAATPKPVIVFDDVKLKQSNTKQDEIDYFSALLENNPEHVSVIGGNKFYTKHYVRKLLAQVLPQKV